jgi:hypothetical protein
LLRKELRIYFKNGRPARPTRGEARGDPRLRGTVLRHHLLRAPKRPLKAHLLAIPDVGEDADFDIKRTRARRVDL